MTWVYIIAAVIIIVIVVWLVAKKKNGGGMTQGPGQEGPGEPTSMPPSPPTV